MTSFQFLKDLVNDSYSFVWLNDSFTVFKSINDIFVLIYTNKSNSLIFYDIIENRKINEIYLVFMKE